MYVTGKYFCGQEISEYGQQHKRVDYDTLARAINLVFNNEIYDKTTELGFEWEQVSGQDEYYVDASGNEYDWGEMIEYRESLEARQEELWAKEELTEEENEELRDIENDLYYLGNTLYREPEIYQWYIVDEPGANILQNIGEVVYCNDELDMRLWGVTHCGTGWDYVLTNIEIKDED